MDARRRKLFRGARSIFTDFGQIRREIFEWIGHGRPVVRRSMACRRDIIIRQASVCQAKFVSAAFARPQRSHPASRIRSFLSSYFFASVSPRRYSGGIHSLAGPKSLGLHSRIIGEPGISEYVVAWERGVCKRISGVSGRVAEAWCEDSAYGCGGEAGGERHAKSHGIYRRCANSAQRNYGDRHRGNRARERPRGVRAVIQPHATQRTSFFARRPDSGRSLGQRRQARLRSRGSRNQFLRMARPAVGADGSRAFASSSAITALRSGSVFRGSG